MRPRLAALLAAVFAAAVIAPPDGVVVHRHVGGDHLHVHEHLASGAHHEPAAVAEHDRAAEHHHHDHDHGDDQHRHDPPRDGDDHAGALSAAPAGGLSHVHTTPLFHQAVAPPPPAAAPPRPSARVGDASPPVRIAVARPATRSRGPPLPSR